MKNSMPSLLVKTFCLAAVCFCHAVNGFFRKVAHFYHAVNGFTRKVAQFYRAVNGFSRKAAHVYHTVNGFSHAANRFYDMPKCFFYTPTTTKNTIYHIFLTHKNFVLTP
jgi:hypothetical protein